LNLLIPCLDFRRDDPASGYVFFVGFNFPGEPLGKNQAE
jgi:hypothetical protein